MKISILITSKAHPISPYLKDWSEMQSKSLVIDILHAKDQLIGGDILFLISCAEVISKIDRDKFRKTLVIHASDLPNGRGWSPYIWALINGATNITLSLLEAEDKVDSGDIWKKIQVDIPKTALYNEINALIFDVELRLMDFAVKLFDDIIPIKQSESGCSYWPKRSPKDSEIDIHKNLVEQFDLIRVCDPNRFPAFFYKDGQRFDITIHKHDE